MVIFCWSAYCKFIGDPKSDLPSSCYLSGNVYCPSYGNTLNIYIITHHNSTEICPSRWMDGSPVGFQKWDENQPDSNAFDKTCVAMTYYMGE